MTAFNSGPTGGNPPLGMTTINWYTAAETLGIPDGAATQGEVLDVLMSGPGGAGKLAKLWPFVETDDAYRTELVRRLNSDRFYHVELSIHALKGGVELSEVQEALSRVALKYAQPGDHVLHADQGTFLILGMHPADEVAPTEAQRGIAQMFQQARTNPVSLGGSAVHALAVIPEVPLVLETFQQILEMEDPKADYHTREEIFRAYSKARDAIRGPFHPWLVDGAIREFRENPSSHASLSASHYLASHIDQPSVCEELMVLLPNEGGPAAAQGATNVIDILTWGVTKYNIPVTQQISDLIERVGSCQFDRWADKKRDELLVLHNRLTTPPLEE